MKRKTQEEKIEYYAELGLNQSEVMLITTPINRIVKDKDRLGQSLKALDKLHNKVREKNDKDTSNTKEKSFIEKVRGKDGKGPTVKTYETT